MSKTEPQNNKHDGLRAVAADATGFGAAELRMTRDLILRPDQVLLQQGQPDSPYPKPFRYYLTLNGLYLAIIAVLGGFEGALEVLGAQPDLMTGLIEASGKSPDSFRADLDQWYSLTAVPLIALANYPPLHWLFRRWTRDGRIDGQVFTFLSAWTLMGMIPGLAGVVAPSVAWVSATLFLPILFVLIWRMGRGVWWTTRGQLLRRFLLATGVLVLVQIVASPVIMAVAMAGAVFAP